MLWDVPSSNHLKKCDRNLFTGQLMLEEYGYPKQGSFALSHNQRKSTARLNYRKRQEVCDQRQSYVSLIISESLNLSSFVDINQDNEKYRYNL